MSNTEYQPDESGDIRPEYYRVGGVETWDAIDAWELDFYLGMVLKYVARCGRKNTSPLDDLRKARTYLSRKIKLLEAQQ